jgi:hypothetical protein
MELHDRVVCPLAVVINHDGNEGYLFKSLHPRMGA